MSADEGATQDLHQSFTAGGKEASEELPQIAAAFLISFDLKVGYTIAWKRSIEGLNLDGVVEFKSLPSGLHNIKEDTVYFVHEQYAGISAFVNRPASESDRNAQFVAFGVLVPLSFGRLGRSWLYLKTLQELARTAAADVKLTQPLEEFWERHNIGKAGATKQPASPAQESTADTQPPQNGVQPRTRRRGLSTVSAANPSGRLLPPSHPILSLPAFIDLFGPLLYPLHRAALLRKRMLLVTHVPVLKACEFVYDISVLSTVSSALADELPPSADAYLRTMPLFIVGVHDIPFLSPQKKSSSAEVDPDVSQTGWIACTTDEILTMKKEIYDIVVELPSGSKRWPIIKTSDEKVVKATQRDLRRWRTLKRALSLSREERYSDEAVEDEDGDERTGLLQSTPHQADADDEDSYGDVVEPTSWSELARSGFMWWASAGERDAAMDQEAEQDATLIGDLERLPPLLQPEPERQNDDAELGFTPPKERREGAEAQKEPEEEELEEDVDATVHMELLAYFHRYSYQIFTAAVTAIESEDNDAEGAIVEIGNDDLQRMGLDSWSEEDRHFVVELIGKFLERSATVKGLGVECCGVRIC